VSRRDDIPRAWTRLWYAKHPTMGEYVIGRMYDRGERYLACARRWKCVALYRTTMGNIVAVASMPDNREKNGRPHRTLLGVGGDVTDGWQLETDADRNHYEETWCSFCRRTVKVRPWNRRARDKCPCGARHFMRLVRQGGKVVAEEEGWRKNGQEWIRC